MGAVGTNKSSFTTTVKGISVPRKYSEGDIAQLKKDVGTDIKYLVSPSGFGNESLFPNINAKPGEYSLLVDSAKYSRDDVMNMHNAAITLSNFINGNSYMPTNLNTAISMIPQLKTFANEILDKKIITKQIKEKNKSTYQKLINTLDAVQKRLS